MFKLIPMVLVAICSLGLASQSDAMIVADSECPQAQRNAVSNPGCHRTITCRRTDGAAVVTANGSPDSLSSGAVRCSNCGEDDNGNTSCPENVPSPTNCVGNLTINFESSFSPSIAIGGTAEFVKGLEASLQGAIGYTEGVSGSHSQSCGPEALPGCKISRNKITLSVIKGRRAELKHTYVWVTVWSSQRPECPNRTDSETGGTRTSIASANLTTSSAECKSLRETRCNPRPSS